MVEKTLKLNTTAMEIHYSFYWITVVVEIVIRKDRLRIFIF